MNIDDRKLLELLHSWGCNDSDKLATVIKWISLHRNSDDFNEIYKEAVQNLNSRSN